MLGPDITEQRSWNDSHAGQLGPFQHGQMSQECAELGTTSLLPSPPPTPHPLMRLLKLCLCPTPSTLSLSSLLGVGGWGDLLSMVPLVSSHSPAPSQTSGGVSEGRSPSPSADPMG